MVYIFSKYRDLDYAWDKLSPCANLKIVVCEYKITRNMKKNVDMWFKVGDMATMITPGIKKGMYKTEKGSHLVAFHKEANLGAT
jgi:hypothetical protein